MKRSWTCPRDNECRVLAPNSSPSSVTDEAYWLFSPVARLWLISFLLFSSLPDENLRLMPVSVRFIWEKDQGGVVRVSHTVGDRWEADQLHWNTVGHKCYLWSNMICDQWPLTSYTEEAFRSCCLFQFMYFMGKASFGSCAADVLRRWRRWNLSRSMPRGQGVPVPECCTGMSGS